MDLRDRYRAGPGRADRLVPPRRLDFAAHSDFVEGGDRFLCHLVELAALQPHERVLDVGCGIGRLARPLSGYLSSAGSYDGFDVNREGIGWCRRRYRRNANFRFKVADVYDPRRNPSGAHAAAEYRFPYDDASFDVIVCASVLGRALEGEADHHLAEVGRLLAPEGRALLAMFLLDDASRAAIAGGTAGLPFLDAEASVAVVSDDVPEEAVAYDRGWVEAALERHGMALAGSHRGTWSGEESGLSFQDLVVARHA